MKKILLIILIIIIILGGFLYIRNRKTAETPGGTTSGFKSFFNFGSKTNPSTDEPSGELSSEFTPEDVPTTDPASPSSPSIFGTSGPFTPTNSGSTGVVSGGGPTSGSGPTGSGEVPTGGGPTSGGGPIGGGGPGTGGTGGGGTGGTQCTIDDTQIEFTPEEIARLQALEQRFYAVAPLLHTDNDVQAEMANYSSYKILNINICKFYKH